MTYRRTITCDGGGCLALFIGRPQWAADAAKFAAMRAGWRCGGLGSPDLCPSCRPDGTGRGPVLERGECPVCTGRQRELAEVTECMYCGHQEPHPADDEAEDQADDQAAGEAGTRCPAAHPEDPTPCSGPVVVTVLDAQNHGAKGCTRHGSRLLASLDGARVVGLPDAPAGTAVRVFKLADGIRPFPWLTGPRVREAELSRAEVRQQAAGTLAELADDAHRNVRGGAGD
ncbi:MULTISPECIES: hypothetical protein [Streptomyces]|uniref:Uncharacterized protein n=1 Tax=Streptomyces flavochromogenes TaxID=68199 RepID=A0ABW6Y3P2_9ACTN